MPGNRKFILIILAAAIAVKIIITAAYFHLWLLPGNKDLIGPDGEGFSQRGWYIAKVLSGKVSYEAPTKEYVFKHFYRVVDAYKGHLPVFNSRGNGLYTYFIGLVYYLFGYAPLVIKGINICISAVSSVVLYLIASEVYSKRIARKAFVIYTFFPTVFIFSMSALRDPSAILCVLTISYALLKLTKNIRLKNIMLISAALILLLFLREEVFVIMSVTAILSILKNRGMKFKVVVILVSLAILFGITKIPIYYRLKANPVDLIKKIAPITLAKNTGLYYTGGRLAYKVFPDRYYEDFKRYAGREDEYFSSPERIPLSELVKALSMAVLYYLVRPFPFVHKNPVYILISVSMIWWYIILALSVPGLLRSRQAPPYPLVALTGVTLLATSLLNANEGILLRHRDMIIPLFIILASCAVEGMSLRARISKGMVKNIITAALSVTLFFLSLETVQRVRYWRRYDSKYWLLYGFTPKLNQLENYKLQLQGLYGVKRGGIVNIPRRFCDGYSKFNPDYPHTEFNINSLGFRKPEFKPAKAPGTYRIAVVGDSTVFGLGVDDYSTLPIFLQNKLKEFRRDKDIEVINLGIPSYTSNEMRNLIEKEAVNYLPDMIIIYGFFNDIYYSDVVFRKDSYLLTVLNSFLLDKSVFYLSLREKLCKSLNKDIGELYRGSLDTLVKNLMKDNSILDKYQRNMDEIIELAGSRGVRVVLVKQALHLVDIASRSGTLTTDRMKQFYDRFYDRIDHIGQVNSVKVVSANEIFEGLRDKDRYFIDGTHLTVEGNELLASIVFDGIKGGKEK